MASAHRLIAAGIVAWCCPLTPTLSPGGGEGDCVTAALTFGGDKLMAHDKAAVRRLLDKVKAEGRDSLTAPEGKLVCDAYGITVPREGVASSAKDAARLATEIGFPVVLKIVSPDILHKTEAGGVVVGVASAVDAEKAYDAIIANATKYKKDAKISGVQVQQMLAGGHEVIIGAVSDPSFGKLVAFGLGGILVEVMKDITFRLAPASARRSRRSSSACPSSRAISPRSPRWISTPSSRRRPAPSPPMSASSSTGIRRRSAIVPAATRFCAR